MSVVSVIPVVIESHVRANMEKLIAYLRQPVLRARFDMICFDDDEEDLPCSHPNCGSVGCALGHAPYAGVEKNRRDWCTYVAEEFGDVQGPIYGWCFFDDWAKVDNTPLGAAARMRWLLDHGGVPSNWHQQRLGIEPLCYSVEETPCQTTCSSPSPTTPSPRWRRGRTQLASATTPPT